MVLIYYNDGMIKNYYSGNTSQIGWQLSSNLSLKGTIHEIIIEEPIDNFSPFTHRVLEIDGDIVVVPKIHVSLIREENKLIINLENLQKTDIVDKVPIIISGKTLKVEPGEYNIELNSNKPIEIHVGDNQFTYKPLIWEVD